MNIRIILFVLGKLAQACGLALMIPFVVALFYGESSLMAFLVAIVISLFLGRLFMGQGHRPTDSLTRYASCFCFVGVRRRGHYGPGLDHDYLAGDDSLCRRRLFVRPGQHL